jgi:hypothetical protein
MNPLRPQNLERVFVETVTWRDENSWVELAAAQNPQAGSDPCLLRLCRSTGKLGVAFEAEQAAAPSDAEMTVAVQADRRPFAFESAHLIPESRIGRRTLQIGVVVVGNDGKDGLDFELVDQCADPKPALARNRGA